MTHREIAESVVSPNMPHLMRQAAVNENVIFLMWLESKDLNGPNHERTKKLARLHLLAFDRLWRRKDKWV